MVEAKKVETTPKAPPKVTAADIPAGTVNPPERKPHSRQLKAEEDLKKAQTKAQEVEQVANDKAAKINSRLIRDGNPNRISGQSREGEQKYFWGYFVPTRELNAEEIEALEGVK
jgi:hypothetical protein